MNQQNSPTVDSDLLSQVRVAAPCSASWDKMPGGEQVRSCEQCSHKVYNLSGMTAKEAADLVRASEGRRVCVRFYRRPDGKMMTQDCPTGVRAVRRRIARAVMASSASVALMMGVSLSGRERSEQPRFLQMLLNRIDPPAPATMGAIRALPMAAPIPSGSYCPEMGEMAPPSLATMGKIAAPRRTSFDDAPHGPEYTPTNTTDKSFLEDSNVEPIDTAYRPDPFSHQPKPARKQSANRE